MSVPGSESPARIDITREHKVYENRYGSLYDDEVTFLPSGASGTYVRWQWQAPYSVAVLPSLGDAYCLIRTYRHSLRGLSLEVPKGFGEEGTDPAATARKELAEETGLMSDELEPMGVLYTDAAFSAQPMHCFMAHGCQEGKSRHEASESIQARVRVPKAIRHEDAVLLGVSDAITMLLLAMGRDG